MWTRVSAFFRAIGTLHSSHRDTRHIDMAKGLLPSTHRIDGRFERKWSQQMTKFYTLIAALAVFAPFAFVAMNQAAQMVA